MSNVPMTVPPPPDPAENPAPDTRPFFGGKSYQWYREAAWFAEQMFKSGTLPRQIDTKEKAYAILCKGEELGLPPFAGWSYIYLTKQNQLAIKSKGALAVVQSKPSFASYRESIENEGQDSMRAVAVATRRGHDPVIKTFSLADAEAAGLLAARRNREGETYDSPWQKFVKDMLLSRARARALDIAFAAELGGIPIEGVAEDIEEAEAKRPVPARVERRQPAALPPAQRDSLLDELSGPPAATPAVTTNAAPVPVGAPPADSEGR